MEDNANFVINRKTWLNWWRELRDKTRFKKGTLVKPRVHSSGSKRKQTNKCCGAKVQVTGHCFSNTESIPNTCNLRLAFTSVWDTFWIGKTMTCDMWPVTCEEHNTITFNKSADVCILALNHDKSGLTFSEFNSHLIRSLHWDANS